MKTQFEIVFMDELANPASGPHIVVLNAESTEDAVEKFNLMYSQCSVCLINDR